MVKALAQTWVNHSPFSGNSIKSRPGRQADGDDRQNSQGQRRRTTGEEGRSPPSPNLRTPDLRTPVQLGPPAAGANSVPSRSVAQK